MTPNKSTLLEGAQKSYGYKLYATKLQERSAHREKRSKVDSISFRLGSESPSTDCTINSTRSSL